MALNCSDIVPEPFGDLADRNACARQEAGESMPHDMRCHPRNFLYLHIEVERPAPIVCMPTFPKTSPDGRITNLSASPVTF